MEIFQNGNLENNKFGKMKIAKNENWKNWTL